MEESSSSNDFVEEQRQFYDPAREKQLADEYFNQEVKNAQVDEQSLKHFGTITSIVGTTAVIQALPTFDLIDYATLKAGASVGEIFDIIGEQFNPLYIARFSGEIAEGQSVQIDVKSIVTARVE